MLTLMISWMNLINNLLRKTMMGCSLRWIIHKIWGQVIIEHRSHLMNMITPIAGVWTLTTMFHIEILQNKLNNRVNSQVWTMIGTRCLLCKNLNLNTNLWTKITNHITIFQIAVMALLNLKVMLLVQGNRRIVSQIITQKWLWLINHKTRLIRMP